MFLFSDMLRLKKYKPEDRSPRCPTVRCKWGQLRIGPALFPAPNSKNPNPTPIGEGFGFFHFIRPSELSCKTQKWNSGGPFLWKQNVKKHRYPGQTAVWFLYCKRGTVIHAMQLKGTLHGYLTEVDKDAEEIHGYRQHCPCETSGILSGNSDVPKRPPNLLCLIRTNSCWKMLPYGGS